MGLHSRAFGAQELRYEITHNSAKMTQISHF